jgi:ribonuclease-3
MDNPHNILITRDQVEDILNRYLDSDKKITVKNIKNYRKAFVHESYYQSIKNIVTDPTTPRCYVDFIPDESNERLEYLGDHILKGIIGRYLYERYPNEREGFLTRLKIKLEKCSMLHKVALEFDFKRYLLLSVQIENQTILGYDKGRNTPSYYEDAFESFIGSILEDNGEIGYIYADRFVRSILEHIIDFAELNSRNDNFKDSLQRYYQSLQWPNPVYHYVNDDSPLNRRVFMKVLLIKKHLCTSSVAKDYTEKIMEMYSDSIIGQNILSCLGTDNYILGLGTGRKNVQAEQDCSRQALINLGLSLNY